MTQPTMDNNIVRVGTTKSVRGAGRPSRAEAKLARNKERARCTPGGRADRLLARGVQGSACTPGGRADKLFARHGDGAVRAPQGRAAQLFARQGKGGARADPIVGEALPSSASTSSAYAPDPTVGLRDAATVALAGTTRGAATRTLLHMAKTDAGIRTALLDTDATGRNTNMAALAAAVVDGVWRDQESKKAGRSNG